MLCEDIFMIGDNSGYQKVETKIQQTIKIKPQVNIYFFVL